MARNKTRKYGSAADRTKRAAAQAGPSGGGGTMFKGIPSGVQFYNPEEGKVTLRLLPYIVTDPKHPDGDMAPVDDLWYKRPFKRFRGIGTEKKAYISPKSIGKPCPILEYYAAAKADPSIPEKEANRAKPQDCVLYNVQVVDRKGNVSEPMLWWYSYHLFEKALKKELLDPDNEDFLTFMDLEGGYDIRVRWEKDSFSGNDFITAGNISFVEREEDIDEEILDQVVDLDNVLNILSYDELNRVFLELDEEDSGGDAGGDEPPAPSSRRRGKDKDDDPPPSTSRRRGKSEPEPKEKEEDDPPPTSRRRKSAEPPPEEKEEKKEESTRRRSRRQPEPEPEPEPKDECPEGLTFGDDWDTKVCCEKCPNFDACAEKYEADEAARKKAEKQEKKGGSSKKEESKGKGDAKGDCPFGFVFGADCDKHGECNDCEKWDDCMDRQEEMEGK